MTRPYKWKPGMREKLSARMTHLNADPAFAEKAARRASIRMREIHEAARLQAVNGAAMRPALERVR